VRILQAWPTPSRGRGYSRGWGNSRLLRVAAADSDKALARGRDASLGSCILQRPSDQDWKGKRKTPQMRVHLRRDSGTGGEGGIRTRGGVTLTRFPIVRIRPDYATSPRSVQRGHYTIVAAVRQIFVRRGQGFGGTKVENAMLGPAANVNTRATSGEVGA
jgi:hypothetical protein